MTSLPTFPLWVDRYLADTEHLTFEEHGAYLRLLMAMWITPCQRLPNDDKWLARRFHCEPIIVNNLLRPLIKEFCSTDGNWITQSGLKREWNRVQAIVEQRTVAAKLRWDKEKHISKSNASTLSPVMHPTQPNRGIDRKLMNGHNGKGNGKEKPHHGQTTKNQARIWFDRDSSEWKQYADDYRSAHNAEPVTQWNGSGTWFNRLGEQPIKS